MFTQEKIEPKERLRRFELTIRAVSRDFSGVAGLELGWSEDLKIDRVLRSGPFCMLLRDIEDVECHELVVQRLDFAVLVSREKGIG